jgi:hypothetical protein
MVPNRLVVNDHVVPDVKNLRQPLVRQSFLPGQHSAARSRSGFGSVLQTQT